MLSTTALKWVAGALILYFIIFIVKFEMQSSSLSESSSGRHRGKSHKPHAVFPHDAEFSGESAGSRKQNQKDVQHAAAHIAHVPSTRIPQRDPHGKAAGGTKRGDSQVHPDHVPKVHKHVSAAPANNIDSRKHSDLGVAREERKHAGALSHKNKNIHPSALHQVQPNVTKQQETFHNKALAPSEGQGNHDRKNSAKELRAHGMAQHVPRAPHHRAPAKHKGEVESVMTVTEPVAFAVVISNEDFIDGALVLGTSFWNQSHLVQVGNATLVAIVPKGAVSAESIERLSLAGWSHILQVDDLTKFAAPHAHYAATFNKLYLFNLTEYHRVATFDVDMLMLRSPDGVFRTQLSDDQWIGALGNSHRKNHSYFQTGMMLIVPSASTFKWLMHEFRSNPRQRDMNGRDGRLIRDYFKDRYVNLDSALSAHLGIHEPLNSVIGFHFRGEFKPWFNKELPPTHPAYGDKSGKIMEQELGEAYRLWWAAYEVLHRTKLAEHDVGPKRATDLPVGYDTARSVWLMRHTSRSYVQTLSDVANNERNHTFPGLRLETSEAGKSCDEVCASQQSICRHDALSLAEVNNCDVLKRAFGCHKCTNNYPGSEEPAYDTLTRVCYQNPLDYKAQRPACNATMSGHERLCPCVPIENAYDRSTPFLGVIPVMHRLGAKELAAQPPKEPEGLHSGSNCYPTRSDYFKSDHRCVEYLANLDNVAWVSVLGRASLVGRTVKVMLHYLEPNIKAMVKFPQKTFPHEAHSEVASYTVDRALGVNRVPPTAFTYFPLDRLRATLANATTQSPDMKSSLAELSVELLDFLAQQGVGDLVRRGQKDLEVGVSVQLWMDDVHRLADSVFSEAVIDVTSHHRHGKQASPLALYFRKHSASQPHEYVLLELSRMLLFDFIIGNDDRTPQKNTFVLGGCQGPHCGPGRAFYRFEGERPQVVLIDQGRSFYFIGNPEDNALSSSEAGDVCVFSKALVTTCLQFSHNRSALGPLRQVLPPGRSDDDGGEPNLNSQTLERVLFAKLPKELQAVLHKDAIHAAQDRLERLLDHIDGCLSRTKGKPLDVLRTP